VRVQRVVIGLIAGLIVGILLGAWPGAFASGVTAVLSPIGQLWVGAIRMTVIPLVVSLMFVSVASRESNRMLGRVGAASLVSFLALLVFSAIVAVVIVPPVIGGMRLSADAVAALRSSATAGAAGTTAQLGQLPGFSAWLTSLVPSNVMKAATDGALLPLILFTLLFALAARHIEPALRDALTTFFGAIAGAMTRIIEWIVAVAPIGVFALVVVAASKAGIALAGAMAYYVVAISVLSVMFALLMYPLATAIGRVRQRDFIRAVFPAQAVAFSSSSSLASLPALVEGARKLGLPSQIGGFVLPLSVATFKVATPITLLTGTLFLSRLYGVSLQTTTLFTLALTAIALSFTAPGVPQGAQLMLAPLLASNGIPAEGIALLIAADTIPDLFGTVTNVTGDLVAGTIVAQYGVTKAGHQARTVDPPALKGPEDDYNAALRGPEDDYNAALKGPRDDYNAASDSTPVEANT
jgi:Na+/H+-dicarboxylate symporter